MGEELREPDAEPDPEVPFTLDGDAVTGREGDTVASALHAAGVRILGRSIRYHRPRGYFCGVGKCGNCLVRVDGEPNVRACTMRLEPGMEVERQAGWPSAELDVLGVVDRVFPKGMDYHERFLRPKLLVPLYNRVIRRLAGFGDPPDRRGRADAPAPERVRVDVVVVGAGPAGLAAAQAASETDASVLLLEERHEVGGSLLLHPDPVPGDTAWSDAPGPEAADTIHRTLRERDRVRVETDAVAVGLYPDRTLVVDGPEGVLEVTPRRVVLAPGTYEAPPAIPRNDLPGIMGARAARLLLHHDVLPGNRVAVMGPGDLAGDVAEDLEAAGCEVAWSPQGSVVEAHGTRVLEAVTVEGPEGDRGRVSCDALVVAGMDYPRGDLLQQAGVPLSWGDERGALYPEAEPDGATPVPWCLVAGQAAGPKSVARCLLQGRAAGLRAATDLLEDPDHRAEADRLRSRLEDGSEGPA